MPEHLKIEESKIVEGLVFGDATVFEYLFNLFFPRLRVFAFRMVDDFLVAEDLVQDVFIAFWESRSIIRSVQQAKSVLFKMTRNTCLNYIKHKKVEQRYTDYLNYDSGSTNLYMLSFLEEKEIEELKKEMIREVDNIISSLSTSCQQVFRMSKFQQLKNREIAEKTGLNIKTVEKHISKAMSKLRDEMNSGSASKRNLLYLFVNFF